jgi:hypothetical protein
MVVMGQEQARQSGSRSSKTGRIVIKGFTTVTGKGWKYRSSVSGVFKHRRSKVHPFRSAKRAGTLSTNRPQHESAQEAAVSQAEHEDNVAIAALVIERKRNFREEDVVSHDEMLKYLGVDSSELR